VLGEYPGTVLLVSHDRDFIDRVATTTLAFEGQGRVTTYAGGWSDMQAQKSGGAGQAAAKAETRGTGARSTAKATTPVKGQAAGLTFTEKKRLAALPADIDRLGAEIAKLTDLLSDAAIFTREPVKAAKASQMLQERQIALAAAEEEWLALAERDQG